jgi:hypothetical protein
MIFIIDILLNESAKSREQADFVKKIVFERLNSGGVKLSPQETRNAFYDGPFNRLCNPLSNAVKKRKPSQMKIETASFYD